MGYPQLNVSETTIEAGESVSDTFGQSPSQEFAAFDIDGDENATDLTFEVTGATRNNRRQDTPPTNVGSAREGIDASEGYFLRLEDLWGAKYVEVTITNESNDETTVSVSQ